MDNQKIPIGEPRITQNKTTLDLFKGLSNFEDFSHSNNQLPQQGKDINFLSTYYNKKTGNWDFIEKISKLNKKFYNCSERYIKSKKTVEKLNDDLYLNLFQQIDCYADEIEKLNKKMALNNTQELKKKIEQLNKEISEKNEKIRNCEKKLKEKTINEEKLKKEIESYKRSIVFYKDKINIGLLNRNRNNINSFNRERTSNLGFKKKPLKLQNQYLSPTSEKKITNFTHNNKFSKDLGYEFENNTKENEDKNSIPKVNKKYKMKESVFYLANKTEYDIDNNDIEEKAHESDNEINNMRNKAKTKTIKLEKDYNDIPTKDSGKNNKRFLNALNEELYGTPRSKNTIENNSNTNLDFFNKNNSDEENSPEKKESQDKEEKTNIKKRVSGKANTIKSESKRRISSNKTGNLNSTSKNNQNVKSKILNQINKNDNTNKKKQIKTTTKSKPKYDNKSIDKISNTTAGSHTPYLKKRGLKTIDKEKEKVKDKERKIPSIKTQTQSSTDSTPSLKYNTNNATSVPSNDKKEPYYKKVEVNATQKRGSEINDKLRIKTHTNTNLKKDNCNSMLNLNIIGRNTSSFKSTKKLREKDNSKELKSVFKDVNDDYLKSIEMLRKQEEQIKYMLRFIELDDEK